MAYKDMLDSAFSEYYDRFRKLNALSKETAVTREELFPEGESMTDADRMHKMLSMDIVKRGDVYNNNRRRSEGGGSDFWESAIVRPDVVLADMVKIMQRGDDMYYHQRLK